MDQPSSKLLIVSTLAAVLLLPPTTLRAVNLGALIDGDPSCTQAFAAGEVTCGVKGVGGALFGIGFDPDVGPGPPTSAQNSEGYRSVGGILQRSPSCVFAQDSSDEVLTCAGVGVDDALYAITFSQVSSFTTGFVKLGGVIVGEPSCANSGDGFATCAARDLNNALSAIRFNTQSGANSGFQLLGGPIIDNPSCVPALGGLNQVICAAKNPPTRWSRSALHRKPVSPLASKNWAEPW